MVKLGSYHSCAPSQIMEVDDMMLLLLDTGHECYDLVATTRWFY
jgi:hypothetical protein